MRFERDRAGDPPWLGRSPRHWNGNHDTHPIKGFYAGQPVFRGRHERCFAPVHGGAYHCDRPLGHPGNHTQQVGPASHGLYAVN